MIDVSVNSPDISNALLLPPKYLTESGDSDSSSDLASNQLCVIAEYLNFLGLYFSQLKIGV